MPRPGPVLPPDTSRLVAYRDGVRAQRQAFDFWVQMGPSPHRYPLDGATGDWLVVLPSGRQTIMGPADFAALFPEAEA